MYFKKYFKNCANNSKQFWKGIDTVVNNKNKKPVDEIFLNENGKLISDTKHVAKTFKTYFVNVAQKLVSKLGNSSTKCNVL